MYGDSSHWYMCYQKQLAAGLSTKSSSVQASSPDLLGTAAVHLLVALLKCPWCDVFELTCCAKSASPKLSLLKPQAVS